MNSDLLDRAHALAEESFLAGSGPGGQNANKVATEVQLRVNIYALRLPPPVFARLRELAGSKLTAAGDLLEAAHRQPKKRARTRLNRIGKAQRLKAKKARGEVKAKRGKVTRGDW